MLNFFRNLNSEGEEHKHKLKLLLEDKDSLLNNQRTQLEEMIKKVNN